MRLQFVVAATLVGVFALFGWTARGQSTPDRRLAVSVGAINAIASYSGQPRFAVYPEMEVYSSLYRSREAGITLGGSLYVAGWMDDRKRLDGCPHCIIYWQRSAILGARMAIRLDRFILGPLSFVGGVGRHWLWADYRSGARVPSQKRDMLRSMFGLEAGTRMEIPISRRFSLEPRVHFVLPLAVNENNSDLGRIVLAAGVSYSL